jgi:antitoxin component YwqK of YwqJK toxin-antitoxin module
MWEENYVNGKMQGLWRTWYDNGHLMQEGYYINENQEGEQIEYEHED